MRLLLLCALIAACGAPAATSGSRDAAPPVSAVAMAETSEVSIEWRGLI